MESYDNLRVFDLLFDQFKNNPLQESITNKVAGKWKSYSTSQIISSATRVALGLVKMGIKKGDKIGLISETRPEWNFVDFACQFIGAVTVPMYPNLGTKDYEYIFNQSEIKVLFVSDKKLFEVVSPIAEHLGTFDTFTFDKVKSAKHWSSIYKMGQSEDLKEIKPHRSSIKPDDLLTIIYTSGTTGSPKGVMLSHKNIVSNVFGIRDVPGLDPGDKALSFLPINHIFERTVLYSYISSGISIYYAESMDTIGENLREIKPHTFSTVPRLLEKVYDKIIAKGSGLSTLKKGVFNWAINLGLSYDPNEKLGTISKKQLQLARKLVFSKWHEALGGNIKTIQCGAAALQQRLMRVFWAADIKIFEGYGLTETSPVVAVNRHGYMKLGTVGTVINKVEIKMESDGEIMVKGPSVMMGYYKNDELTKDVIQDGWFKTGDIGTLDNDGYLSITDRKKELFKTSGGLYIAPQQLENALKESGLIDQAMIVGDGKKFPAALISPNFEQLTEEASKRFMLVSDYDELLRNPDIIKLFQKEIEQINQSFGKWEKIKEYRLISQPWSVETGELTPTLKLKRRVILEKYQYLVDDIYKDDGADLFKNITEVKPDELDEEILDTMKP